MGMLLKIPFCGGDCPVSKLTDLLGAQALEKFDWTDRCAASAFGIRTNADKWLLAAAFVAAAALTGTFALTMYFVKRSPRMQVMQTEAWRNAGSSELKEV